MFHVLQLTFHYAAIETMEKSDLIEIKLQCVKSQFKMS